MRRSKLAEKVPAMAELLANATILDNSDLWIPVDMVVQPDDERHVPTELPWAWSTGSTACTITAAGTSHASCQLQGLLSRPRR